MTTIGLAYGREVDGETAGYTGTLWEDEFLDVVPGHIRHDKTGYRPFREAARLAKENQPDGWNPEGPSKPRAAEFYRQVREGLEDAKVHERPKFYTARGSALDRYHGVDAIFELSGRDVTVDFTVNPHKTEYRADVVVGTDFASGAIDVARKLYAERRGHPRLQLEYNGGHVILERKRPQAHGIAADRRLVPAS